MKKPAVRPYLISKDEDGRFRVSVRTTRFNSQGYPLVSTAMLDETFATATAARTHAKTEFDAQPGDFATK